MTASRRNDGFTLVEVLVAVVILTIAGLGVVDLMTQGQGQQARRRASEAALQIARNEIERVQIAGAWNAPTSGTVWSAVDETGTPAAAGPFYVRVFRLTDCDPAAPAIDDSGAGGAPCVGAIPSIQVNVWHVREGATRLLVTRSVRDTGSQPANGTWSLAGTP